MIWLNESDKNKKRKFSMHEAISAMLSKYECQGHNDYMNALREIVQEIALLGLWRGKFFEKANLRTLCKECHKAKSRLDSEVLSKIK